MVIAVKAKSAQREERKGTIARKVRGREVCRCAVGDRQRLPIADPWGKNRHAPAPHGEIFRGGSNAGEGGGDVGCRVPRMRCHLEGWSNGFHARKAPFFTSRGIKQSRGGDWQSPPEPKPRSGTNGGSQSRVPSAGREISRCRGGGWSAIANHRSLGSEFASRRGMARWIKCCQAAVQPRSDQGAAIGNRRQNQTAQRDEWKLSVASTIVGRKISRCRGGGWSAIGNRRSLGGVKSPHVGVWRGGSGAGADDGLLSVKIAARAASCSRSGGII